MQSRPRISIGLLIATFLCALLLWKTASAQTSADFSAGGSVRLGWDSRACDGTIAGNIRYNSSTACAEFCNGSDWTCPDIGGAGGCTAPALCPDIGDVCDDGNAGNNPDQQFAGFMVYNDPNSVDVGECKALYVTGESQSLSSMWNSTSGTVDISVGSTEDGKVNHAGLGGGTFPAFDLCEDENGGDFNDWYLPARDELHLLWKNRTAINANASGSMYAVYFWSSAEHSEDFAWFQHFGAGTAGYFTGKDSGYDVRCVRRD